MKKTLSFLLLILSCHCLSAFAVSDMQLETNKRIVVELYNEIINQKNFDAANQFLGDKYVQHNPLAQDGAQGLKAYIQYLRDTYPLAQAEIKRVFAEGDYVVLHVHTVLEPGTRGFAVVDIFKLDKGKVVEHWDVRQSVPETSANPNGMF